MTEKRQDTRTAREKDDDIVVPETPTAADTLEDPNPAGRPGMGRRTGEDVQRPRTNEASSGEEEVVPGFTTTGSSGSQGGRSLYGVAPKGEVTRKELEGEEEG